MSTLQLDPVQAAVHPDQSLLSRFTVEPIRGSNDALQQFVESTWSSAYSGRMTFPVWSKEYFDWQLQLRAGEPDRRLAVYDSGRLVAVLLGTAATFRTPQAKFGGAHWSWLSVAESHRGLGLAALLDNARVEMERAANSDLVVSYRFNGSRHSLAERPSNRDPLKTFHTKLGFWARPLDGRRIQRWNLNHAEGWLSRAVHPFLPVPRWPVGNEVRMFECGDLSDCQRLAQSRFQNYALSVDWDEQSLLHQLTGSPISQTVVAQHGGRVRGFVNFHILPFQAATREPVAVIDVMCVNELPIRLQVALVKSALSLMAEQGAILALKIRTGDLSVPLMLRTNFTPRLRDSSLVLQWMHRAAQIPAGRPIHCLWR